MRRLTDAAAWLVAPGFVMWKRAGGTGAVPWRALWFQSLTRIVLVVLVVWLITQSQWWPAALLVTALTAMTLMSAFVARHVERFRRKQ